MAYQNVLNLGPLWMKYHTTTNMDVVSLGKAISEEIITKGYDKVYPEIAELTDFFKQVKTVEYFDELLAALLDWGEQQISDTSYKRVMKKCQILI